MINYVLDHFAITMSGWDTLTNSVQMHFVILFQDLIMHIRPTFQIVSSKF